MSAEPEFSEATWRELTRRIDAGLEGSTHESIVDLGDLLDTSEKVAQFLRTGAFDVGDISPASTGRFVATVSPSGVTFGYADETDDAWCTRNGALKRRY